MNISTLSDEEISNLMDTHFYEGDSDIEDVIEEYGKKRWTTGGWGWYLVGPLMVKYELNVFSPSHGGKAKVLQPRYVGIVDGEDRYKTTRAYNHNTLRAICECILMIEIATK